MDHISTETSFDFSSWLGRKKMQSDRIDIRTAAALAATFDDDVEIALAEGILPPLWHWAYFTSHVRSSGLGQDGHPQKGDFLPPVALPNRMWAGGRLDFYKPMRLGTTFVRCSEIIRCEHKQGRSGELVFVTVQHTVTDNEGPVLTEEQDIVYRHPSPKGASLPENPVQEVATFFQTIHPDAVMLFRYSALTFNAHRIHYDLPYATEKEGYPGLVVHGPLTATLLLNAFRNAHPEKTVRRFAFRAVGPLYDISDFNVCGRFQGERRAVLWTDCKGHLTMQAELDYI